MGQSVNSSLRAVMGMNDLDGSNSKTSDNIVPEVYICDYSYTEYSVRYFDRLNTNFQLGKHIDACFGSLSEFEVCYIVLFE